MSMPSRSIDYHIIKFSKNYILKGKTLKNRENNLSKLSKMYLLVKIRKSNLSP